MRWLLGICLVWQVLCASSIGWAWSDAGHKVVASVAFRKMTPTQRAAVIVILEQHPRFQEDFLDPMPDPIRNGEVEARQEWLFHQASVWPDLIKSGPPEKQAYKRNLWHFINKPLFLTEEDRLELEDSIDVNVSVEPPFDQFDLPNMNVVQAILNSARIVGATDQLESTKAVHICWLLHNIGDLHQPMHSSALFSRGLFPLGDRGGNSVKTQVNKNLHTVWDQAFGASRPFSENRNQAIQLLSDPSLSQIANQAATETNPVDWWQQCHKLAVEVAYGGEVMTFLRQIESAGGNLNDSPVPLSEDYMRERSKASEPQAVRAGARCAQYLISLTGDTPHPESLPALARLPKPGQNGAGVAAMALELQTLRARLNPAVAIMAREAAPANAAARAVAPFADYDTEFDAPDGVPTFKLSQDYPRNYDQSEKFPWMEIDYRSNSVSYLKAVLKYCLEGNTEKEVDFRGQENATRNWYHAPWMHNDSEEKDSGKRQGREYHHGLTRERSSRAHELHPFQGTRWQNWAVSMYSPRGGYTLGKVWKTQDGLPDPRQATFPDNTVSFKLLFSSASDAEVPYLKGSFPWTANINPVPAPAMGTPFERVDQPMRLLQVDVAVKDPRVGNETGWIFGTFIYDGSRSEVSSFDRLVPVGLVWGDDSTEKRLLDQDGSFLNPFLRESAINPELIEPPLATPPGSNWSNRAFMRHYGLGGRLNGPVDNPTSSCISCHGRAGTRLIDSPSDLKAGMPMPILTKTANKADQIAAFDTLFSRIRPNSQLVSAPVDGEGLVTFVTVDYSLQISQGIRNFYQAQPDPASPAGGQESLSPAASRTRSRLPQVLRGEDE